MGHHCPDNAHRNPLIVAIGDQAIDPLTEALQQMRTVLMRSSSIVRNADVMPSDFPRYHISVKRKAIENHLVEPKNPFRAERAVLAVTYNSLGDFITCIDDIVNFLSLIFLRFWQSPLS